MGKILYYIIFKNLIFLGSTFTLFLNGIYVCMRLKCTNYTVFLLLKSMKLYYLFMVKCCIMAYIPAL